MRRPACRLTRNLTWVTSESSLSRPIVSYGTKRRMPMWWTALLKRWDGGPKSILMMRIALKVSTASMAISTFLLLPTGLMDGFTSRQASALMPTRRVSHRAATSMKLSVTSMLCPRSGCWMSVPISLRIFSERWPRMAPITLMGALPFSSRLLLIRSLLLAQRWYRVIRLGWCPRCSAISM